MDGNLDLSTVLEGIERWRKTKLRIIFFVGLANLIFLIVGLMWIDMAWYWSFVIFVPILIVLHSLAAPLMKRR